VDADDVLEDNRQPLSGPGLVRLSLRAAGGNCLTL
jgi:hypothetical protein